MTPSLLVVCPLLLLGSAPSQPPSATPLQSPTSTAHASQLHWDEAPILTHHARLTSPDRFTKAGEAYFSPDGKWIIFQAVETGRPANAPYAMFVAPLTFEGDRPVGIGEPILMSPPGSANTCGWFHPTDPTRIMLGSTIEPLRSDDAPGYKPGSGRYVWAFPEEMEVCSRTIPARWIETHSAWPGQNAPADWDTPTALFKRPGYDAECSWSADGRYILYAHVEPVKPDANGVMPPADADIWIRDTRTGADVPLVAQPGYDGGPFFSPDGKWICYRSDRARNDHLQIYIAELAFDPSGVPTGVSREIALTNNEHVNWCPYWDASGRFLVYATSERGHDNYEVFAVDADPDLSIESRRRIAVTQAPGADVLPAFDPTGKWMMWTSRRLPPGADEPSTTQLWIARYNSAVVEQRLMQPDAEPEMSN